MFINISSTCKGNRFSLFSAATCKWLMQGSSRQIHWGFTSQQKPLYSPFSLNHYISIFWTRWNVVFQRHLMWTEYVSIIWKIFSPAALWSTTDTANSSEFTLPSCPTVLTTYGNCFDFSSLLPSVEIENGPLFIRAIKLPFWSWPAFLVPWPRP